MGFLNLFSGPPAQTMVRLPSGSFTINSSGQVVASTLPQSFPAPLVREIGMLVLHTFRSAAEARTPLSELVVDFSALKIKARELRGGAIIFLFPQGLGPK